MQEEFLNYIWKYKLFELNNLTTICNEPLTIIHSGNLNFDAGPDFSNAKIEINQTLWAGNLEIHIKSSDWKKHNHHLNKYYDSVILHVVWDNDEQIFRTDNTPIPTLELKNKVANNLYLKYQEFKTSKLWIPCQKSVTDVESIYKSQWLNRLIFERLELKSTEIFECLKYNNNDWEYTFYSHLAVSFGFKVNAVPFKQLSKNLPLNLILKYQTNTEQLEALVFGTAGFLDIPFKDDYPKMLQNEFDFLRIKHHINTMNFEVWKFSKLRPKNFPTIRLAQFVAILKNGNHLFSKVIESESYSDILQHLTNNNIHDYWNTHYIFDKSSKYSAKNLGIKSVNSLIINVVTNILFAYGKYTKSQKHIDMAFTLLENIKAEENVLVQNFKKLGFEINVAAESQAILQLKYAYCDLKNCLNCEIGNKILKR